MGRQRRVGGVHPRAVSATYQLSNHRFFDVLFVCLFVGFYQLPFRFSDLIFVVFLLWFAWCVCVCVCVCVWLLGQLPASATRTENGGC
jgi:hypothetical protein